MYAAVGFAGALAAVNGRLTSEQALRELLAGTSLEATRTNNGGFAIRRPAVSGATLPTINVMDSETAAGPVQGYVARRSSSRAVRITVPPASVPSPPSPPPGP